MASLNICIDATEALRTIDATMNSITIFRLSEMLHLSLDETTDWLVCKVAQFRGMSEDDVARLIEESDREV